MGDLTADRVAMTHASRAVFDTSHHSISFVPAETREKHARIDRAGGTVQLIYIMAAAMNHHDSSWYMVENVTGRQLKTTQASLEILNLILEHDSLTLAELGTIADSSKSSIRNCPNTLLENRYLVEHDGVYRASSRVTLLDEHARHRYPGDEVVKRVVDGLASATDQETNPTVFEHGRLLICYDSSIDGGRDADDIRYWSEYHPRSTATGKAIFSELDRDGVTLIADH